jgi:hypothetical protein
MELVFEIFFNALLKPFYYVTIRPLIVIVGYLSFPIMDKKNRTLYAKNELGWDELEDIGWQSLSGILGILLVVLLVYVLFCFSK